jgi:antirestriction protein ArdC
MLVCLQFESIGRRKRQDGRPGTRQVHLIVSRAMSPPHARITNASRRTVAEPEDGVRLWVQPWKSST